jgi:transposase InsO family protein
VPPFWFLPNKISAETVKALSELLEHYPVPYSIWTDNGKEFEGDIWVVLQKQEIRHIYTAPYNRQQNGKCERFWCTIETAPKAEDLPNLVAEYNRTPHFGLGQVQRTRGRGHMTPLEVWSDATLH